MASLPGVYALGLAEAQQGHAFRHRRQYLKALVSEMETHNNFICETYITSTQRKDHISRPVISEQDQLPILYCLMVMAYQSQHDQIVVGG